MKDNIKAFFIIQGQIYSIKMIHNIPRIGEEVLFRNDILCKVDIVVYDYTSDEHIINIGMSLTCKNTETMEEAQKKLNNHLSMRGN